MSRKRYVRPAKIVTVTIQGGLVADVKAPKGVNVVINDYDIEGWDYRDYELKKDAKNRRYAEEVWEGGLA